MHFPCQEQRNPLVLANGSIFALFWGASDCVITDNATTAKSSNSQAAQLDIVQGQNVSIRSPYAKNELLRSPGLNRRLQIRRKDR